MCVRPRRVFALRLSNLRKWPPKLQGKPERRRDSRISLPRRLAHPLAVAGARAWRALSKIAADKALAKNRKRNSKCKDKVAAKLAAAPVAEEKATDSGEDSSTGEHELSDESANSSR